MLGEEYRLENPETTRNKILLKAAWLFACKGVQAVSMQDIAAEVGIKAPSIYNHFASKEELLRRVYDDCAVLMDNYYSRLLEQNADVHSIEEVGTNLFLELQEVLYPFVYHALCVASRNMHCDKLAYELYINHFFNRGVDIIAKSYEDAIRRKLVEKPFDTQTAAYLVMSFVAVNNSRRVGEQQGLLPAAPPGWYDRVNAFFINTARQGV